MPKDPAINVQITKGKTITVSRYNKTGAAIIMNNLLTTEDKMVTIVRSKYTVTVMVITGHMNAGTGVIMSNVMKTVTGDSTASPFTIIMTVRGSTGIETNDRLIFYSIIYKQKGCCKAAFLYYSFFDLSDTHYTVFNKIILNIILILKSCQ